MISRSQRVTTKLFEEVMKKGRVLHSPLFVVRVLSGQVGVADGKASPARISAVAAVKVAKTSVLRHRIRRRIYEAARPHLAKLAAGNVIIFVAKPTVVAVEFADLKQAVNDIFVKAGLLR